MNSHRIEYLWLLFFPRRCVWCQGVTEALRMLCPDCEAQAGSKRLAPELVRDTRFPLVSVFGYHTQASRILLGVKYHGGRKNAHSIGYAMAEALAQAGLADEDALFCAVPMTERQVKARGFNHSELLARAAARWLGVEYAPLLCKTRETETQHDLPAAQRDKNVAQAYAVAMPEKIAGRRVVLCDDICTTGATMRVCAAALREAGAGEVICLTFLRTELEEERE